MITNQKQIKWIFLYEFSPVPMEDRSLTIKKKNLAVTHTLAGKLPLQR